MSISEELERLARLKESGAIDAEEFAAAKKKVLTGESAAPPSPASQSAYGQPGQKGSAGNIVAAIASFLIPGLGQLAQGSFFLGFFFFVGAVLLWFLALGWIVHIIAALHAASYTPEVTTDPAVQPTSEKPVEVQAQGVAPEPEPAPSIMKYALALIVVFAGGLALYLAYQSPETKNVVSPPLVIAEVVGDVHITWTDQYLDFKNRSDDSIVGKLVVVWINGPPGEGYRAEIEGPIVGWTTGTALVKFVNIKGEKFDPTLQYVSAAWIEQATADPKVFRSPK